MTPDVYVGIGFATLIFLLAVRLREIEADTPLAVILFSWFGGSIAGALAVALITWVLSS